MKSPEHGPVVPDSGQKAHSRCSHRWGEDFAYTAGLGQGWLGQDGEGPAYEGLQCPQMSGEVVLTAPYNDLGCFSKLQGSGPRL